MNNVCRVPSFPMLLQDFFVERLMEQRGVSPETISSYRDSFRLFLQFASERLGRCPSDFVADRYGCTVGLGLPSTSRDRET